MPDWLIVVIAVAVIVGLLGWEFVAVARSGVTVRQRIDRANRRAEAHIVADWVRELHKPLRRYHDGSGEFSMDTAEDVAREYEIPVEDVDYFEVCAHCAYLETWHPSEAGVDYDYRESLWPCATIRALLRREAADA